MLIDFLARLMNHFSTFPQNQPTPEEEQIVNLDDDLDDDPFDPLGMARQTVAQTSSSSNPVNLQKAQHTSYVSRYMARTGRELIVELMYTCHLCSIQTSEGRSHCNACNEELDQINRDLLI